MQKVTAALTRVLDRFFPPREDELIVRTVTSETLAKLVEPKQIGSTTALLTFTDPQVHALTQEAKYHGSAKAFELLAEVLGDYLIGLESEEGFSKAILVPVPLGTKRRAERGYNQSEEVARRAARHAGVPLERSLLLRTRDTPSQTNLARWQRHENVTNAFLCPRELEGEEKEYTYIVFDDVTTTGATLDSASSALRAAGAARVIAIALAH